VPDDSAWSILFEYCESDDSADTIALRNTDKLNLMVLTESEEMTSGTAASPFSIGCSIKWKT